jgi:N-methylhydantoinase A
MLERRGARTVLVTTAGFEDILEIGRQARPLLYCLEPDKPEPLVARNLRLGLKARTLADGTQEVALGRSELQRLARLVRKLGAESVAVCLLHAHINPDHERLVAKSLGSLGIPVSTSHQLSPAPGEYERSNTTVVNAYVQPMVAGHIESLARNTRARRLRVMQSNGGAIGVKTACREPIRTMLSGPAGGVAAAFECARRAGVKNIVTFDMGGTSTDVALVDGAIPRRELTNIGNLPVRCPSIDIHTVGAGGGSIARVDDGGSLLVGPESAGARPGPACYGKGSEATVTDANLVLGRLIPEFFLGGNMEVYPERAHAALGRLGRAMGLTGRGSVEEAAEGVVRIVEANMERALRIITVERGHDPRDCTLLAFGGAAPLHACALATGMGMTGVMIPADPGLLSAHGVMQGPVVRDLSRALTIVDPAFEKLQRLALPLQKRSRQQVQSEGIAPTRVTANSYVKLRYLGQSLELEVPLSPDFRRAFDHLHQDRFHYCDPAKTVEAVAIRATATGRPSVAQRPRIRRSSSRPARPRPALHARTFVGGRWRRLPVFARERLKSGVGLQGPAIIVEYSSTVLLPPGWSLRVDGAANLMLESGHA